jgi:hypothetical protein
VANSSELKKYHFIYKTTNLLNGDFYVGVHSTNNLNDDYLGSGKRLKRSVKKYGKENFKLEVLEFFNDRSSLMLRENEIVNDSLLSDPNCMNLKVGGTGGFSQEAQVRNSKKGNQRFIELMKNDEWKNNQRQKQSIGLKNEMRKKGIKGRWEGKKHSNESKRKIGLKNSKNQTGNKNSQYNTCWITNDSINKKIKMSENLPEGWRYGRKNKREN